MKSFGAAITTLLTALVAHIPCCGPTVLLALGGTTAGAGWLEPLHEFRPWLLAFSFAQLAIGFWLAYRQPKAICPVHGVHCDDEKRRRKVRIGTMWIVAAIVLSIAVWPEPVDHDHAGHDHPPIAAK